MSENEAKQQQTGIRTAGIVLSLFAGIAIIVIFARPLLRFVRESLMQRVTSAHYEILCPPGALTQQAMMQFASQREAVFTSLDAKLRDAGSNSEIRIIFDPKFPASPDGAGGTQPYTVTGTTIRTTLNGQFPQLDPAADAEALLYVAWGAPGNARVAQWAGTALVGQWHGEELGMAAAGAEQKLGHQKLSSLLDPRSSEIPSPGDRALLGAAWVREIVEFGGPSEVRKLYSSKAPALDVAEAANALGTTPVELERKWQLWMYAYLAGMPPATQSMPMNMQMKGQ